MKRVLLLLILVVSLYSLNAEFIQIGEEEQTSYETPTCGIYDFGWSETLYRQSEIGESKILYEISYSVSNNPSFYTMSNQKVYLKNVADTLITLSQYSNPATQGYTLVFDGDVTFNGGWNSIEFNTPFTYNGLGSLAVLVENRDGDFNTGYPYFHHMPTPGNTRLKFNNQDNTFPLSLGDLEDFVPSIRLYYYTSSAPEIAFDLLPYSNQEDVALTTGLYWLNGATTESNTVYFGTDSSDLSVIYDGIAIQELSNEILGGNLSQSTEYFWQVISTNSHGETSTGIKSFMTLSNELTMLVGIGNAVNIGLPWEPEDRYSYTQTIYGPTELILGNVITSLSYYWNGISIFNNDIEIYYGFTDHNQFYESNSWLPLEELTLVFDNTVTQVPSNSWMRINLESPILIDHSRSMVIAIRETTSMFESSADNFYCTQTAFHRSLTYSSMSDLPDPANPPNGVRMMFTPNTRFHFFQDDEIIYMNDDFENNPNFALEFTPWISLDLDGHETRNYEGYDYPNQDTLKGFMTFNHGVPEPTIPGTTPHSGNNMAVSFPTISGDTDDWLIGPIWDVPSHYLGELDGITLTFWAKSHYIQGADPARLKVLYSEGSSNPDDFMTTDAHPSFISLPTDWTEYTVIIPPTSSGLMRIAFNGQTVGYTMLYLDDVSAVVSLQNVSIDEEIEEQTPNTIISSNYPNPFNPETTISFTIPESEIVTLDVYNVRGQLIKSLLNSHHNPGTHSVMWKGNDTDNRAVPSGVYFYKLQAGSYTETKKMVLLK